MQGCRKWVARPALGPSQFLKSDFLLNLINKRHVVDVVIVSIMAKTIHPTENFEPMSCVITWDQKKISLQTQKKKAVFLKKKISNWDFDIEISHLREKIFILTSKM